MIVVKTLMGAETRSVFDLPDNNSKWSEIILQKLNELNSGVVRGAEGSVSWLA